MDLLADLSLFFQGLDAVDAVADIGDGSTASFRAYFNAPFALHTTGGVGFETADYRLTCIAEDVRGFVRGETTVTVDGKIYDVESVEPDGAGIAAVVLTPVEVA